MSNLSSDLGGPQAGASVTQGQSDIQQNAVTGGLNLLATTIGGFASQWQKAAQLKRQAAEDARAEGEYRMKVTTFNQGQQDRSAEDLVTRQANAANQALYNPTPVGLPAPVDFGVSSDSVNGAIASSADTLGGPAPTDITPTISTSAAATIAAGAAKLNSFQAAANQGKMSPVAVQSQADMLLNSILTQHPELNAGVVAAQIKSLGVDNGLFRMIKTDQDNYNDQQARVKAQNDAAYAEGAKWLSPDEAKTMTPDQITAIGQQHILTDTKQKADSAALALQQQQTSATKTQYDFNNQMYSDQAQQIYHNQLTSYLNPYMQQFVQFNNLAPDGGSDPNYELQRAKLVPLIQQKFEIALNKTAANITDPTARNAFIKSERDNFQATYIAPMQSRDPAIGNALKGITQYLGFKADLAMPMLAQMKAAGMRLGDITPMLQALPKDALAGLSKEYAGIASNRLDPQAGKIVINHMIGVLNGTDSLTNVRDPKLRQTLVSTSANMVLGQAQAIAAGKGDAQSYSGTMKTLVLASASVTRGDPDVLSRALGTIATNSNIAAINKLLSDPGTHPDGVELATGTRASAAHLVANSTAAMQGQAKSERYFYPKFDAANGKYTLMFDNTLWAKDTAQRGNSTAAQAALPAGVVVSTTSGGNYTKPQPSTALTNLVSSTNQGLNFLSHTSAWDKTAPESGEAPRDIANYYATGTLTPKMQAAAAKAAASSKTSGNALTIGTKLEQDLTRHMTDDIPTGMEGTPGASKGERNNNPGNLEDGTFAKSQPGYTGSDGRFAQFATPEHGVHAQEVLLSHNYVNKGINTINSIVDKYLGTGSENSPASRANYKKYIASKLNIDPNDTITNAYVPRLAQAMREFETGKQNA